MSDEKRRVLEMVAEGKLTREDAARLLDALGESGMDEPQNEEASPTKTDETDTPRLTLFPDGDLEQLSDSISETVEQVIGQAMGSMEEFQEKMDGLSEKIDRAVEQAIDPIGQFVEKTLSESMPPEESPEAFTQPYEGSVATEELTSLTVHWVAGPVEIVQGEGETIRITEFSRRPLEPDERMGLFVDGGEVTVHWTAKKNLNWFGKVKTGWLSKRLLIELPASADHLDTLEIHTGSGSVNIPSLQPAVDEFSVEAASGSVTLQGVRVARMTVHTASGALFLQSVSGDELSAHTASGSLLARQINADDLELHTVSGSLTVESLSADELDLKTVSGSMNVSDCKGQEVSANTVSGALHLTMTALPHDLDLASVSGGVILTLPDEPDQGFTVQYSTRTGSFRSDFPLSGSPGGKGGEGTYGAGQSQIGIQSMTGGIRIRKA